MARNRYRLHAQLAILAAVWLVILLVPAIAFATPGSGAPALSNDELEAATSQSGERVDLESEHGIWDTFTIEITDLAPGKEPTLLVRGFMKKGQKRPVVVGIPVPDDAQPIWAGEIFGTDPSKDVMRKITVEQKKGYRLIEFNAEHSPYAQVEMSVPKGVITKTAEDRYRFRLGWIPDEVIGRVRIGVHIPGGYHGEKPSKGMNTDVKKDGSSFWFTEFRNVAAQKEIAIDLDLVKGEAAPPASAQATSGASASASRTASATAPAPQPAVQSLVTPPAPPTPRNMLLIVSALLLLVFGGVFTALLLRQGGLTAK